VFIALRGKQGKMNGRKRLEKIQPSKTVGERNLWIAFLVLDDKVRRTRSKKGRKASMLRGGKNKAGKDIYWKTRYLVIVTRPIWRGKKAAGRA